MAKTIEPPSQFAKSTSKIPPPPEFVKQRNQEFFEARTKKADQFIKDYVTGFPSRFARGFKQAAEPPAKVVGKGLGALGVPFERLERAIATPLTAIAKARADRLPPVKENRTPAERIADFYKRLYSGPENLPQELKEIAPSFVKGAKALVPYPGMAPPEETSTFTDFAGEHIRLTQGREASTAEKNIYGLALSFGVTVPAAGQIAKGIRGTARLTGIPQKIAAKGLPAFKRAKLITGANVAERVEKAEAIGKTLGSKEAKRIAKILTKETGRPISAAAVETRFGQLVRGGITTRPELAKAVHPAVESLEANAKQLRTLGILGEETFLTKLPKSRVVELKMEKANVLRQIKRLETAPHYIGTQEISAKFPGRAKKIRELNSKVADISSKLDASTHLGGAQYMPRMYKSKEEEAAARKFWGWSKTRIKAHYAKQRKDIPEHVRKFMGEIKEPAFPVTKGLMQQAHDIELAKLYKFVDEQPGWASKVWEQGLSKKSLPDTKAYGALRGKYVHPKVFADVTELHRVKGNVEQTYDAAIGAWKLGKVVLNPATHMRNKISNKILLDMSGMGYVEQGKYAIKGLQHARRNSEDYQFAKKFFARTTLKSEILDDLLRTNATARGKTGFGKMLDTAKRGTKAVVKKPAELYQHEEFTNKFMKYLQQRDLGKSPIEAVEEANKWLFDYNDLAVWEKNIARRVVPFYTFPRKAIPRVLEAVTERPLTIMKYPLAAESMTRFSLAKLEISPKDYEDLQAVLPDYMDKGSYMLMPYRDKNGDLRFFDWTYILPWGELSQVGESTNVGSILMSNPMVRIPAELAANKSIWSGRKIYDDEIPPDEQTVEYRREQNAKKLKYFWGTIAPSLAPKGLYWDRLIDAATGRPPKTLTGAPKEQLLPETLAHTIFGLRTQPINVKEQKMFRLWDKQRQIQEVQKSIKDIELRRRAGNIEQGEYEQQKDIYIKQMQKIIKEAQKLSTVGK